MIVLKHCSYIQVQQNQLVIHHMEFKYRWQNKAIWKGNGRESSIWRLCTPSNDTPGVYMCVPPRPLLSVIRCTFSWFKCSNFCLWSMAMTPPISNHLEVGVAARLVWRHFIICFSQLHGNSISPYVRWWSGTLY